jgi:hypothetical protein
MAKHFGSFDANLELRYPDRMLSKVRLHSDGDAQLEELANNDALYVVHATPTQLFVWNAAGFIFGQRDQRVVIHVIKRDKVQWFETVKGFHVQRGNFIF